VLNNVHLISAIVVLFLIFAKIKMQFFAKIVQTS